jgi:hypothetical protein
VFDDNIEIHLRQGYGGQVAEIEKGDGEPKGTRLAESHVWIRVKLLFNSILIQRFVAVSPFAVLPSRYLTPAMSALNLSLPAFTHVFALST